MTSAHIIEDLCFDIDFASEDEAFEAQERLMRFAQGRAQQVIAEVFDEAIEPNAILRLEKLHVDIGTLTPVDFEDRFAERLRDELRTLLRDRQAELGNSEELGQFMSPEPSSAERRALELRSRPPEPGHHSKSESPSGDHLTTGARAELDWLLHFIVHGCLPWHAPAHIAQDVQALAARVLEGNGVQLTRALRAAPVSQWPVIFRRLVAQFPAEWLAELGRQIGLAKHPPSVTLPDSSAAPAVLDSTALARSRFRAQIEAVLSESPQSDFALGASMPAASDTWRGVLRDDASWLKATLLRLGRGIRARRRLAAVLPKEVVPELLALWLSPTQVDIVLATIGASTAPFNRELANTGVPREAVSATGLLATLTYILVDGGALEFSESGYRYSLANQAARDRALSDSSAQADQGAHLDVRLLSHAAAISDARPETSSAVHSDTDLTAPATPESAARAVDYFDILSEVGPVAPDATHVQANAETIEVAGVSPRTPAGSEIPWATNIVAPDDLREALARSRFRAQIEAVLSESPQSDFALAASMPVESDTWRGVLRDDASWLKETLLRLGRGIRVRRRLAAALPQQVVPDLLALWLSPAQVNIVLATIGATAPLTRHASNTDILRDAISPTWLLATLSYILVDGGAREFSESGYRHSLANASHTAAISDACPETSSAMQSDTNLTVSATPESAARAAAHSDILSEVGPTVPAATHFQANANPVEVSAVSPRTLAGSEIPRATNTVAPDDLHEALVRSRSRAQIEAVLSESPESDFVLVASMPVASETWRSVLRNDAPWLKETLLRLGRGIRIRRRLAAVLPEEVVPDLLTLWLSPTQVDTVLATIGASTSPFTREPSNTDIPRDAISPTGLLATLTYILVDGGAWEFNESGYRRSLENQAARFADDALDRDGISASPTPGAQSSADLRPQNDRHDDLERLADTLPEGRATPLAETWRSPAEKKQTTALYDRTPHLVDPIDVAQSAANLRAEPRGKTRSSPPPLATPRTLREDALYGSTSHSADLIDIAHSAANLRAEPHDKTRSSPLPTATAHMMLGAAPAGSPESRITATANPTAHPTTDTTAQAFVRSDSSASADQDAHPDSSASADQDAHPDSSAPADQDAHPDPSAPADQDARPDVHLLSHTAAISDARSETSTTAWFDTDPTAPATPESAARAVAHSDILSEVGPVVPAAAHFQANSVPIEAVSPNTTAGSEIPRATNTVAPDDLREALVRSRARAEIEAVLSESPESDFVLVASMPVASETWRSVLRNDAPWLKATLLRLGRGIRARRRLAAALPQEVVPDLLALWLSPAQIDAVLATISTTVPLNREASNTDIPRDAISPAWLLAILTYILVDGGAWEFSESGYRHSLANQTARDRDEPLGPEGISGSPIPGLQSSADLRLQNDRHNDLERLADTHTERRATPLAQTWRSLAEKKQTTEVNGTTAVSAADTMNASAVVNVMDAGNPLYDRTPHSVDPIDVAQSAANLRAELRDKTRGSPPPLATPRALREDARASSPENHTTAAANATAHPAIGAAQAQDNSEPIEVAEVSPRKPADSEIPRATNTVSPGELDEALARSRHRAQDVHSLPDVVATSGARPDVHSLSDAAATSGAHPDVHSLPDVVATSGARPGVHPLPDAAATSDARPDVRPLSDAAATSDARLDLHPLSDAAATSDARPDVHPLPDAAATSDARPDVHPLPDAAATSDARPDAHPLPDAVATSNARLDVHPETSAAAQSETNLTAPATTPDFAARSAVYSTTLSAVNPAVPAAVHFQADSESAEVAEVSPRTPTGSEIPRMIDTLATGEPHEALARSRAKSPTINSNDARPLTLRPAALEPPPPATPAKLADSTPGTTLAASGTNSSSYDDDLLRYLRGASNPSSPTDVLRRALRALLDRRSAAARHALLSALEYSRAAHRLAALLAGGDLPDVLQWLRPTDSATALAVASRVTKLGQNASGHAAPQQDEARSSSSAGDDSADISTDVDDTNTDAAVLTRVANELLLTELFEEGRTFDPEPFARRLTAALDAALRPQVQAAPTSRTQSESTIPERSHSSYLTRTSARAVADSSQIRAASAVSDDAITQRIYIANAGVVIVGPYLPRLFSMLGLTDKGAFTTLSCAYRAVHLIQYIVTRSTATPEPMLVLNKILCGLPVSAPIPLEIDLRAQEQAAIEDMLTAIIAHWKAIGRTSIAGLRESFLQREGRLVFSDDAWRLRVESKSFDMLLDRLPWGYATVKYPWMKRVLHVEWR